MNNNDFERLHDENPNDLPTNNDTPIDNDDISKPQVPPEESAPISGSPNYSIDNSADSSANSDSQPETEDYVPSVDAEPVENTFDANEYNNQIKQKVNQSYQNYGGYPPYYQNQYSTQSFNTASFKGYGDPPQRNVKDSKKGLKIFSLILAFVVFVSLSAGFGYLAGRNTGGFNTNGKNNSSTNDKLELNDNQTPTVGDIKPNESGLYTSKQVSTLVSPSVVSITVYSEVDPSASAFASGIILDKNGYVLSNDHIYSSIPSAKFVITLKDGRNFKANYVAGDTRSDLCVLKMENPKDITPATFGDSDKVTAGEDVIAIGSPYGFSDTVTKGIVSTPSRRISFATGNPQDTAPKANYSMKVIQSDAATNYGSSGGALVNMYGQVIGVNSSKIVLEGYEGMCFAIPSNTAKAVAKDLVESKRVVGRAKLGISYKEINGAASMINGMPQGLLISEIGLESDMRNRGVAKDDIITKVDGKNVSSSDTMLDVIESKKAGDSISVTVYLASSKTEKTISVKLLEDKGTSSYQEVGNKLPSTLNPFNAQ